MKLPTYLSKTVAFAVAALVVAAPDSFAKSLEETRAEALRMLVEESRKQRPQNVKLPIFTVVPGSPNKTIFESSGKGIEEISCVNGPITAATYRYVVTDLKKNQWSVSLAIPESYRVYGPHESAMADRSIDLGKLMRLDASTGGNKIQLYSRLSKFIFESGEKRDQAPTSIQSIFAPNAALRDKAYIVQAPISPVMWKYARDICKAKTITEVKAVMDRIKRAGH